MGNKFQVAYVSLEPTHDGSPASSSLQFDKLMLLGMISNEEKRKVMYLSILSVLFKVVKKVLFRNSLSSCMSGAPGVHERQPHPLELELRATVCLLEIELGLCITAAGAISH